MDEQEFWSIIALLDWSETGDDNAVIQPAVEYLSQKSDDDICQFCEILTRLLYEIDGLAWAENMGDTPTVDGDPYYSPEGFLHARCSAVGSGEATYNDIRENPANMPKDMEFQALLHLADQAWERKHGHEPDYEEFFCDTEYSHETFSNEDNWT